MEWIILLLVIFLVANSIDQNHRLKEIEKKLEIDK